MRPVTVSVTGVGSTTPICLDDYGMPETGLRATVTGTVAFQVEVSLDDYASLTNWNVIGSTGLTASQITTVALNHSPLPATAVRVTITSGTGTVALTAERTGLTGT